MSTEIITKKFFFRYDTGNEAEIRTMMNDCNKDYIGCKLAMYDNKKNIALAIQAK